MSTERVIDKDEERSDVEQSTAPRDPRFTSSEDGGVVTDRSVRSGPLTREEGWVVETERDGPNDGRSVTRTTFYPWETNTDGPSQLDRSFEDRRSWSDLAKWNDGMWDPDRYVQNFDADVRRWVQTFCGYLDLAEYQCERVQYIIDDLDLDNVCGKDTDVEKVIVATISLVVDAETVVDDIDEWDVDQRIVNDERFEQLMSDVGMDRSKVRSLRPVIRSESSRFE